MLLRFAAATISDGRRSWLPGIVPGDHYWRSIYGKEDRWTFGSDGDARGIQRRSGRAVAKSGGKSGAD
jgi:hypothetical protein